MVTEYYPGEKEFGEHLSSLSWWEREPTQQVEKGGWQEGKTSSSPGKAKGQCVAVVGERSLD